MLDKFDYHLYKMDSLLTKDIQLKYPNLSLHYNLHRISQSKNEEDLIKRKYYIDNNLEIYNNINHSNPENYYLIGQIAINPADFVDLTDRSESLKFYTISNSFAHKLKDYNLINFNRMRIAGCLLNKNQINQAIDSLRQITKTNSDINISYLHYHTYINAFNKLGQLDSVKVYENLANEINIIFLEKSNEFTGKLETNYLDVIKKVDIEIEAEAKREKILNYIM